jgi:hypothetical protein
MLLQSASPPPANPARARGLHRAPLQRAPCEPAQRTPMPDPVEPLVLLVLHRRVRQARIDSGEYKTPEGRPGQTLRLYDIRTYKDALAELAYLRRLAAGGRSGGTIVTSMPQLVVGLAALHPAWTMSGDKFADRDRHHRAVRRRLRDLHEMGLLRWRVGIDVDGEDARTEIDLLPAPDVSTEELDVARTQLRRWEQRYGRALNTGSSTGIRGARRHARPLTASERQRRGIARTRARASSRRGASSTNSDPHCVAPPTSENTLDTDILTDDDRRCGLRTGARANGVAIPPPKNTSDSAASKLSATAAPTEKAKTPPVGLPAIDAASVLQRVAAHQAQRQPVLDLIAAQAAQRALETASWTLDRGWPLRSIQEAWVVWRYGPMHLAERSWTVAGPLQPDDLDRLRRAATRYERHAAARPDGFPAGALSALAMIGEIAAARDMRPRTLHYAIRLLDQLSRRIRASATTNDPAHRTQQIKRARGRRERRSTPAVKTPLSFRTQPTRPWPLWAAVDDSGEPIVIDGELQLDSIYGSFAPKRSDPEYAITLRDAQLLSGWQPLDGRAQMAASDASHGGLQQRRAHPGPYHVQPNTRGPRDPDDVELARLAAISLQDAKRLPVKERDRILEQLRAGRSLRDARDRAQWWQRLDDATPTPGTPADEHHPACACAACSAIKRPPPGAGPPSGH